MIAASVFQPFVGMEPLGVFRLLLLTQPHTVTHGSGQ